jgi:hypothetical protein
MRLRNPGLVVFRHQSEAPVGLGDEIDDRWDLRDARRGRHFLIEDHVVGEDDHLPARRGLRDQTLGDLAQTLVIERGHRIVDNDSVMTRNARHFRKETRNAECPLLAFAQNARLRRRPPRIKRNIEEISASFASLAEAERHVAQIELLDLGHDPVTQLGRDEFTAAARCKLRNPARIESGPAVQQALAQLEFGAADQNRFEFTG